ncbi:MAG: laccase domain-containing protein [Clostridia bacterium]
MVEKYDCNVSDIIVCIGPSIRDCCFTSQEESFKQKFTDVWKEEEEYIYYDNKVADKFHIDLVYILKKDLINRGLKDTNIVIANICTRCNFSDFFSNRYFKQNEYKDFGTFATIAYLS